MLDHQVFLEGIPLLLVVDLVQVLPEYGQGVRLCELLALGVSRLPNEFRLEDLRVVADARVHVLSQHRVQLPQTRTQSTRVQRVPLILTVRVRAQFKHLT